MSVVMQRTSTTSSSSLPRTKTSKLLNQPVPSVGRVSGASYMNGYQRTTKHGHSSVRRPLPNGPGPLPNRPKVNACTFATGSRTIERRSYAADNVRSHHNSLFDSDPVSRRKGYDTERSYERRLPYENGHMTFSSRNKSKSLSSLNVKSENSDKFVSPTSTSSRLRTDSYAREKKGYLPAQPSLENDHRNFKHPPTKSSVYRSTTHLDYKDHWENETSQSKVHSFASEKDLNSSSYGKGSFMDTEKVRKVTITAIPGSDLKSVKKSSLSSSNSSPSPTGRRSPDGLVGLRNLGNTCFMNSVLQCLSHTTPLREQLLMSQHLKGKLIQAFVNLLKQMWKPGSNDTLSPHEFKTQIQRFAPRFMGYSQQDAQEFLRFLLEGLHDDLNDVKSKPKYRQCEFPDSFSELQIAEESWGSYLSGDKSLMTDLFVGQLKSKLTFASCKHTSVTFDPFWDLSIPIPKKTLSTSSSLGRRHSGVEYDDINIRDCMLSFTREEVLDNDEQPTCDKCKARRKATKKFSIQRFPQILVLHLKRFSGFSYRSKLQSNVEFPLSLDLTEFSSDPEKMKSANYSLYAVSNHTGSTYGGHYTAYCKHPIGKDWHSFNDSRVDSIPSSRVRGSQAYILFYERINSKSSL